MNFLRINFYDSGLTGLGCDCDWWFWWANKTFFNEKAIHYNPLHMQTNNVILKMFIIIFSKQALMLLRVSKEEAPLRKWIPHCRHSMPQWECQFGLPCAGSIARLPLIRRNPPMRQQTRSSPPDWPPSHRTSIAARGRGRIGPAAKCNPRGPTWIWQAICVAHFYGMKHFSGGWMNGFETNVMDWPLLIFRMDSLKALS